MTPLTRLIILDPPSFLQGSSQQVLDLPVQAAQIVVSPPLNCVEDFTIYAQRERFAVCHRQLLIEGTRVDDRLSTSIRAKHHE